MARKKRAENATRRPRGTPFKKGNTAAVGHGRPTISPEYRKAIDQIEPDALGGLAEIVRDPRHKDRQKAIEYVLNRKHGKPTERREISGPGGEPVGKQFPELVAALDKLTGGE